MKNWKTSLGAIVFALATIASNIVPTYAATGLSASPGLMHVLSLVQTAGIVLMGLAAKDASTHSTFAQVQASTAQSVSANKL